MAIAVLTAVWVTACGGYDLFQHRVPNWLMVSGWIGAAALRVDWIITGKGNVVIGSGITLAVWGLALTFSFLGWWGAADAKFIMALSLAFPDLWMLLAMMVANLVVALFIQATYRNRAISSPKVLPAVTCLGAGWLVWVALTLFYRLA